MLATGLAAVALLLALARPGVEGRLQNARNLSSYVDTTTNLAGLSGGDLAVAPDLRFDCAGRVTRWEALMERRGEYVLQFSVWRMDDPDCYVVVAVSPVSIFDVNETRLVTVELEEPIEVEPGDVAGVYAHDANGIFVFVNVEIDETAEDFVTYYKEEPDLINNFCSPDISSDVHEITGLPLITATVETNEGTIASYGTTSTPVSTTQISVTTAGTTQEDTPPTSQAQDNTTPTTPAEDDTTPTTPAEDDTTPTTPAEDDTTPTTPAEDDTTPIATSTSPTQSSNDSTDPSVTERMRNVTLIGGIPQESFISALTVSSVALVVVVVIMSVVILWHVRKRSKFHDSLRVTTTDAPQSDKHLYTDIARLNTIDKKRTSPIYTEVDPSPTQPQPKEHDYENMTKDPGYQNVLQQNPESQAQYTQDAAVEYEVPMTAIENRYKLSTPGVYEVPIDAQRAREEGIEIVYASPKVPNAFLTALKEPQSTESYCTPMQTAPADDEYVPMASVTADMLSPSVVLNGKPLNL